MRLVLILTVILTLPALAEVPLDMEPGWMSAETDLYGTGLDIGDIDGNGWLDLAVSNGNDMAQAPNTAYFNQDGVLPEVASWQSADQLYSGHCQLADIDQDGYPELMVANYIGPGWTVNRVQVYANDGGVLSTLPTWVSPAEFHSFRAVFGDPDQDGDLDLAVATGEAYHGVDEPNLIFFNEGGVLEATASWTSSVADASYDVKFVDFDGDGDQDLAFLGGGGSGRIRVYFNEDGVIQTAPGWTSTGTDNGNTFDFDDLDGDGLTDMLVGYNDQLGGSGRFAVYLTDGDTMPTTPSWTSDFSGYGSAVVCCDIDGQSGPDLVTGGWWEPLRIYLNDGLGGFAATPDWTSLAVYASVVENIAFADLDEGRTRVEVALFEPGQSLLALPHRHLQAVTGVTVGGAALPLTGYCASLRDGWVSLAAPAAAEVAVTYRVSDAPDLAISNWDDATFVFENQLPTAAPDEVPLAAVADLRAWPNPFNPQTTIGFRLGADAPVARLRVYDLRGRLIDTLHEGALTAGSHRVDWQPRGLASGIYLYRLEAAGTVATGKVVLAR